MNLGYKVVILAVIGVLVLVVASPALQRLLVPPQTEFFTELGILGPEQKTENYPVNIVSNANYNVFLEVSNHLGHRAYYTIEVKFRTEGMPAPDRFARTPSSLSPLYSVNLDVADKETWELPVTFSFDYSYDEANSRVNFNRMIFNGDTLSLNGYSATWDAENNRFLGNLIFELWIYDDAVGGFTYHERYIDLKFNMIV